MDHYKELLDDWLVRAKRKTNAHASAAAHFEWLHKLLGVPTVAVSAVTGTAVVAQQVTTDPGEWSWWVTGIVVLAAMLSSIQTFLNYGARAERHKAASAEFSGLRRRVQWLLEQKEDPCLAHQVTGVREVFDSLIASEPIVPTRIWREVEKKYPRN